MKTRIKNTILELVVGDITRQNTAAIVNAANDALMPGGGVCGAIYSACGSAPFDECKKRYPNGINTGQAILTSGGKMPFKVIHAVGPIWYENAKGLDTLLDAAYWNSLIVAADNGLKSIAFPSLSTGIFGYPLDDAALVAINAVTDFLLKEEHPLELVRFVLFNGDTLAVYEDTLRDWNQARCEA